ncbi:hypothetical protein [Flavobacterium sp. UBA4197]|nr:hypothetical protein [Flavobacterium sp. UBA4197]
MSKKSNNEADQPNANLGTSGFNKAYLAMLKNRKAQKVRNKKK